MMMCGEPSMSQCSKPSSKKHSILKLYLIAIGSFFFTYFSIRNVSVCTVLKLLSVQLRFSDHSTNVLCLCLFTARLYNIQRVSDSYLYFSSIRMHCFDLPCQCKSNWDTCESLCLSLSPPPPQSHTQRHTHMQVHV